MEFKSDAQKACYEKIAPWMKEIFGDFSVAREDAPIIGVIIGSSLTTVAVYPWGDDDTTIHARSYCVSGADLTPDLLRYLLEMNDGMRFGAWGVDSDGDIFFGHTIVGSTVDRAELKASAMAVASTADKYDDEIVAKWGGQRASDSANQ